jgi:hypothetical protein
MSNNFIFQAGGSSNNIIAGSPNRGRPAVARIVQNNQSNSFVFRQNWPVVGTTSAIVRGTAGVSPFESVIGNVAGLSVVDAATEGIDSGCPTTNALRTDLIYVGGAVQNMDTAELALLSNYWTPPNVGGSTYFRVYKRLVYPHVSDPPALGNGNHCLEQYSGGGNSWSFTFHTAAGGWNPIFNIWVAGAPTRFTLGGSTPIYLSRNVWYRIEMAMHRTDTNLREHELRIYNASNDLVYGTSDFSVAGGASLSGYSAAYGTSGESATGTWFMGTNGPHVIGATVGCAPAWYWAAAAVSLTDWCGAYTSNG